MIKGWRDNTYLIPRVEWSEHLQCWQATIEERTNDGTDEVVMGWYVRDCATPFEALEAVTTEYVQMMSNTFNYYLDELGIER